MVSSTNTPLFIVLLQALLLFTASAQAQESLPEFQGYYVKIDTNYVSVEPFRTIRFGFHKLKDIVHVERNSDELYLHVYKTGWTPEKTHFYTKPLTITHHDHYTTVTPRVKALGDDRYLLKFPNTAANQVLFIADWNGEYAVTLGDPQKELVKLFEQPNPKAYAVVYDLREALQAYPENTALKNLLPKWEKAHQQEKDNREWEDVQNAWKRYESAGSVEQKIAILTETKNKIAAYLQLYPNGIHKAEAKKLGNTIEEKLKL